MLDGRVSNTIGRIYAAAAQPDRLSVVLEDLIEATGAGTLMLAVADTASGSHSAVSFHGRMTGRRAAVFDEYAAHRYAEDPCFAFTAAHPRRGVLDSQRDLPASVLADTDFGRWMADAGVPHWLLRYGSDPDAVFAISLHPGPGGEPCDDEAKALFALLFPHFENAVRLAARPPALDVSDDPLLVLGPGGVVRAHNAAAEALLAAGQGLFRQGRAVRPVHPGVRAAWDRALATSLAAVATGGAGGVLSLPRGDGRRALAAVISPLPAQAGIAGSLMHGALVRVIDPDAQASDAGIDRARRYWSLTPAETRVAAALLRTGCDLRAAGDLLDIRYATMRTHVAALLAKTDASGQGELMRLLTRLTG